jgi:hypothetical protein
VLLVIAVLAAVMLSRRPEALDAPTSSEGATA